MTTRAQLSQWFDNGLHAGATHMIIVCDTFDYDDYPVYVTTEQSVSEEIQRMTNSPMQKVMEVYQLGGNKEAQLAQDRAYNDSSV
jgi:hypothetical protein